jgi:hypothetical protein
MKNEERERVKIIEHTKQTTDDANVSPAFKRLNERQRRQNGNDDELRTRVGIRLSGANQKPQ